MTTPTPPDIVRIARVALGVSDLDAARRFWVDLLGLVVTAETEDALYLRAFDEFLHHNLELRRVPEPGCLAIGYRVRTPADLDRAQAWFEASGCATLRGPSPALGIGDSVRVMDRLGFPLEFFHEAEHVPRLQWRYDLQSALALHRLDHVNVVTPDVAQGIGYVEALGFRITEDIRDEEGRIYAAWARRKPTVHDVALTGGPGPRLHHLAFAAHETHDIIAACDRIGALGIPGVIERGPGRHGVSNAFYLYLRDPDGHRVELYTQDYDTGDPDNPLVTWDVHDPQRRDWWGNPVVPSWYNEASLVLDFAGQPVPLVEEVGPGEATIVGADGFGYGPAPGGPHAGDEHDSLPHPAGRPAGGAS